MRSASSALTILFAGVAAISLSAQNQAPAQPRGAATMRIETVNGRETAAGEVLVKIRGADPAGSLRALGALADAGTIDPVGRSGVRRLRSRSMTTRALLARLAGHPSVEYVEPNYILHAFADSNDPSLPQLWGLKNVGQGVNGGPGGAAGADIHATDAWNYATGSLAHVVAVVDTGVDYTHPDLAANMWSAPAPFTVTIGGARITCPAGTHGFNAVTVTCNPMDDHNHGTHVAGTIGASGNNGLGVVGVNWVAQIMGIKFLDANGSGTVQAAINGIEFAIQARQAFASSGAADVRVLSASWGGTDFSQALLDEILAANDHDMLFVAAAGNNGTSNDILPTYPASYTAPNVVAVAATTNTDARAFFSNYSATSVHLGAPGVDVLSTTIGGSYAFLSGTSMATPHVSGAAALLLSLCPMDTAGVKNVLVNTAEPVAALAGITVSGGRLDLYSALRSCVAPPEAASRLTIAPGDSRLTLKWAGAAGATGFNVKRSVTPGGPYTPVATNVTGRTFTDTAVVNGTTYYYVVSGVNGLGEGAGSNEASATPSAPSDLTLASLTIAAPGGAGMPMTISSTATNRGPGGAVASSTRFYLSTDAALDTTDPTLGTQPVPALAAGASFTASSAFTVPVDTPAGLYYLFGKVDSDDTVNETSDSNNSAWRQVFIGPDLVVTSLNAPAGAAAGSAVLVSDTVNNRGGGTASRSTTRFYLSADVLLSANDVLLTAGRPVSELPPGASESGSATVTLPAVAAGTYFIVAAADGDNAVAESIESNNSTFFRAIRIGGDLAVSALTVPAKAGAGDTIQVTDTTTNVASGGMGAASVTRFYLSTRSMFDGSATLLPGSHPVPDLAAGASSTATTMVALPGALPVATYYLFAVADADNAVGEILESNNATARAILVGGDLAVSALTAPGGGASGGTIVVSDTTTNQGGGAVPASITRFYLSKDALLDGGDAALDGARSVPALAAGISSAGSTSVTIPGGVAAGAYFLIAKADADGAVPESSEINNAIARAIAIGPDLAVTSLTAVFSVTAGSTITVADVVTNVGGETAGPSVTRYYLSANGAVNASARVLDGSRTIEALAAGASSSGSVVLTIPRDIPNSALYLVAKADADGTVAEGVESNNTRERVILILPPR